MGSPPTPAKPTVLVVDDEANISELVADACRRAGCHALAVTSAASAMEILDRQSVEVLVCDLVMSDIGGIRLMERCAQLAEPPKTIVMTAYGSLETAQRAMRLGAFDYVLKPFDVDDLVRRIQSAAVQALAQRRPRRTPHKMAVLLLEPDGQIHYASEAVERLLGRSSGGLAGTNLGQWLQPATCRGILELVKASRTDGRLEEFMVLDSYEGHQTPARLVAQKAAGLAARLCIVEVCDFETEHADRADPQNLEWARNASITDPLTGLYNHRYFQEELRRARRYCQRYGHPLSLLLIDVDDFEEMNRRFGHCFGDQLLCRVAEVLRRAVRAVDVLSRYGGDEFVLVLPETAEADAIKAGRRLCAAFGNERIRHEGVVARLRLSMGLASCDAGFIESEEELVHRAGEALRAAKRAGKDRLVTWTQVVNTEEGPSRDQAGIEQMAAEFGALTAKLKNACLESVRTLVAAVEAKDPYTCRHSVTVAQAAADLARRMGFDGQQVESIKMAASLHDIGKIGIPDQVLTKPGALTEQEYDLIKQHPVIGASILEHATVFRAELPIIRHHHERWDGRGYPAGLAETAIPFGARILAVCDATDAMLSDRAYRDRLPLEAARQQLVEGAGTQFDPRVVQVALEWLAAEGAELYEATGPPQALAAVAPDTAAPRPASSDPG